MVQVPVENRSPVRAGAEEFIQDIAAKVAPKFPTDDPEVLRMATFVVDCTIHLESEPHVERKSVFPDRDG
jgi:hypothetical protein